MYQLDLKQMHVTDVKHKKMGLSVLQSVQVLVLRGTQQFVSVNICSEGLKHLRYSDVIPVKTRDFFGKTSPQTFVTRGLTNSYCFRKDKYVV